MVENGEFFYLFNDAGLKESLAQNDLKRGLETLKNNGWLICENNRHKKQKCVNGKTERFYWIKTPEAPEFKDVDLLKAV